MAILRNWKSNKAYYVIYSLVVLVLIVALTWLIIYLSPIRSRFNQPIILQGVEVKEYQEQKLSSVTDFRENSIKGPQYVDINNYHLKIDGLVGQPKDYTYDEVLNNFTSYKKVVTLNCVEGWSATILWEGKLLKDILNQAEVLSNAKVIIFHAVDGYTSSFPIDYILNNNVIMAYKMNDVVLPPQEGFPFFLVAEDKWGYKWVKWINEIELSDNINYRGYWESRGYTNGGDLDKYFLGP